MEIIDNKNIIYKNSKSFFWASKFLPSKILEKVINIYSFCRTQDDRVDEGIDFEDSSEIIKLQELLKSYGIGDNLLNELISGVNSDKDFIRYEDNSELLRYCYKVAGVVGLMMTNALEIDNKEAKYFAIDLGIAMQLTNISRDVMQDYKKNRIYLPKNTRIDSSIFEDMNKKNEVKINKNVRSLLIKADIYYKSSLNGIRYIPVKSRIAILVALRIYQAIGLKIKKTGTKFLYENIYVTRAEKIIIVFKAIIEFLIFFIFPVHREKHNAKLHESLLGLSDVNTR